MAGSQQIMGLASGMDTAAIIDALMNVEKKSTTVRTQTKIEDAKLKLEAYRQVNIMLSSFSSAMGKLSSAGIWSGKTAKSSNESSLTATVTEFAQPGTYQYRVAQLASVAQHLSKGYASQTSKVSPNGSGTISIDSSKARVDNSAGTGDLNGGKGVYRGAVRIHDASGNTAVVDLATCMTVNDIVNALNAAEGVSIKASVNEEGDGFTIEDLSGGTGALRVFNYGGGTTAEDLGLAGMTSQWVDADGHEAAAGAAGARNVLAGESIWRMGADTALGALNDGRGVEKGQYRIQVTGTDGASYNIDVDLRHATSVGDVVDGINNAVERVRGSSKAAGAALGDMQLGISEDGRSLEWTGLKAENRYVSMNLLDSEDDFFRPQMLHELGIGFGTYYSESNYVADSGLTAKTGNVVFGKMDSPMLSSLAGANGAGVGSSASQSTIPDESAPADLTLSAINAGKGMAASDKTGNRALVFTYQDGRRGEVELRLDNDDAEWMALVCAEDTTVRDVADYLNTRLAAEGLFQENGVDGATEDFRFVVGDKGLELRIADTNNADINIYGNAADDLGIANLRSGANNADYVGLATGVDDDGHWIRPADGATKLSDLKAVPGSGTGELIENFISKHLAAAGDWTSGFAADAFTVSVGGATKVNLLSGMSFSEDTTLDDLTAHLNSALNAELGTSGQEYFRLSDDRTRLVVDSGAALAGADGATVTLAGGLAASLGAAAKLDPAAEAGALAFGDIRGVKPGVTTATSFALDDKMADLYAGGAALTKNSWFSLTIGEGSRAKEYSFRLGDAGFDPETDTVQDYLDKVNAHLETVVAQAKQDKVIGENSNLVLRIGAVEGGDAADAPYNGIGLVYDAGALGLDLDEEIDTGFRLAMPTGKTTFTFANAAKLDGDGQVVTDANGDPVVGRPTFAELMEQTAGVDAVGRPAYEERAVDGVGSLTLTVDGLGEITLSTAGLDQTSSLSDLLRTLNGQIRGLVAKGKAGEAGYEGYEALDGLAFKINDAANGIAVENGSKKAVTFASDGFDTLADDLGLGGKTVRGGSYQNGGDMDRRYIGRATALSTLNGGGGVSKGSFRLVATDETYVDINIQDCATVGDVIDLINYANMGVTARVNDTGDGILLEGDVDAGNLRNVRVEEVDGKVAAQLGLLGAGKPVNGRTVLDGSFERTIEVGPEDTLQDVMFRLDESGAPVTASIIQDGTTNPYRLAVTADASGAMGDFILDTDIAGFGFTQSARGKDSVLLYGEPGGETSPIALVSSTNTNGKALLGVTLELASVSKDYVSITVGQDKTQVVAAVEEMVAAFNDFRELFTFLNTPDEETGDKGILQGDVNLRNLMDQLTEMFYASTQTSDADGKNRSFTFFDLGLSFEKADDETGLYSGKLALDTTVLQGMVSSQFDWLRDVMASNADLALASNKGSVYSNAAHVDGYGPENLIDGNATTSAKGFLAQDTIANGANQITLNFGTGQYLDYLYVNHWDTADEPADKYGLSHYLVEYLDANGRWQELQTVSGNSRNSNLLTFGGATFASAIRITANGTNAADGRMRLGSIEAFGETGLVGEATRQLSSLTDSIDGWWATHSENINSSISDLEDMLAKQEERLVTIEDRLMRQYTNMEVSLSQLQQQGDYLQSQLDAMANLTKKK